jgi:hypothetical protein
MLLRPSLVDGESREGHRLRLAFEHGIANPAWLADTARVAAATGRVKLCPACLSLPSGRWQATWTVEALWCEQHGVWLVDRCADCGRRWTWATVRFDRCACGAAHARQPTQRLPAGLASAVAAGDWQLETLRWLGALSLHGLRCRPAKKAATRDMRVKAVLATRGYEVARQWPDGWFELLKLLAAPAQRTSGLRNFNAEWPHLMAKIRAVRSAADRQRLEAATQAFVLASRRSQLPIVGRNVAPAPTLRSLAAEAGIGLRQLNSALAKGRTSDSDGRSRRRRVVAVPQGVLHEQAQRQQSISRAAAARALGLSPARVDHLVGEVLRSTPHGLEAASVEALGSSVARAPLPQVIPASLCRLGEAMRLLIPGEATVAFVRALQRADLGTPLGDAGAPVGALLVDREEVQTWWVQQARSVSGFLTLPEVGAALGAKEEVVTQLVRAGLIDTVLRQRGRRKQRVVTREDLARFSERYCKLKELAAEHGIAARQAYPWAMELGLRVVTGPQVDGRRQYFVLRPRLVLPSSEAQQPMSCRGLQCD